MIKKKRFLIILSWLLIIFLIFGCNSNSNQILKSFLGDLDIPTVLKEDIELKTEYHYQGYIIQVSWTSTNPYALSNSGEVKRGNYDQNVLLQAKASLNDSEEKKVFQIKVLRDDREEIIDKAIRTLIIPNELTSSINLPSVKVVDGNNVFLTWHSSNVEALSDEGVVTRLEEDTLVVLTCTASFEGKFKDVDYNITILKAEEYEPSNLFHLAPLYTSTIVGETSPGTLQQFNGAIYRKAVSSRDYWLGIEVVVTLPEFIPDETRFGPSPYSPISNRYLDNASVYLGGNSYSESDVGLSFSIGAYPNGQSVNYSESIAYRPFWRWIDGTNNYANSNWRDTHFYYYPGDKVRMSVYVVREHYLQLRIELLEETTIPKYVARRQSYNLGPDYPKVFTSSEFKSSGHGVAKGEFKRVVAIDQVGNEGKPAQNTNAKSLNTIFHEVYLYRKINNTLYKVPMIDSRYASINAPSNFLNAITVSYTGLNTSLGAEQITLDPDNNH